MICLGSWEVKAWNSGSVFPPCAAVAGETIVSLDGSEVLRSVDRGEGEGSVPELEQEGYRLGSKALKVGL